MLEYFDNISLSDDVIDEIIEHLKKTYGQEQELLKQSQQKLRKDMDLIQGRISKLIDMHLDGAVDTGTYRTKLEEYKTRQRELTSEMQAYVDIDETCVITAGTVLNLAKHAKKIFESSNTHEKQQLLKFVYSNLKLDGEKLHLEVKEPLLYIQKGPHQLTWLGRKDSNLRMAGPKPAALPLGYAPINF